MQCQYYRPVETLYKHLFSATCLLQDGSAKYQVAC